jgi:hypothetical protein
MYDVASVTFIVHTPTTKHGDQDGLNANTLIVVPCMPGNFAFALWATTLTLEHGLGTGYSVVLVSRTPGYRFPERIAVMKHGKMGDCSDLSFSRRRFMQQVAAAAAFTAVPRHVLGGQAQKAPSEKLNIAGVGIGGVGRSFLQGCAAEAAARIAFLCDVDHQYADPVFKEYPEAKRYRDYREMLDKESGIDAVLVATPDHTHAVITMEALRRGKHVLCVKPLTRTIHEARMVCEAARKAGVATQVTAASSTSEGASRLCEIDLGRRDWRDWRGALLVESAALAAGHGPAARLGPGACTSRLGPVDRPGPDAPLQGEMGQGQPGHEPG